MACCGAKVWVADRIQIRGTGREPSRTLDLTFRSRRRVAPGATCPQQGARTCIGLRLRPVGGPQRRLHVHVPKSAEHGGERISRARSTAGSPAALHNVFAIRFAGGNAARRSWDGRLLVVGVAISDDPSTRME